MEAFLVLPDVIVFTAVRKSFFPTIYLGRSWINQGLDIEVDYMLNVLRLDAANEYPH